jgi:uridine phosphorylase
MTDSPRQRTSPDEPSGSPLFAAKQYGDPSVFTPEPLLAEARRQKDLPDGDVPNVCVLDPDGDLVRHLVATDRAEPEPTWPGYHTDLYRFTLDGEEIGIIGYAVGAPFAVLVAEQLFASGCEFLVSVTSAGQIVSKADPPYFVLVERALRDEGTSHHYAAPGRYATLSPDLRDRIETACRSVSRPVYSGATWTTDAPFRETQAAIERARSEGILAVEMEAAGLYTFAAERDYPVVCFAYVTNEMGQGDGDFEKGAADGSQAALEVVAAAVTAWRAEDGDP